MDKKLNPSVIFKADVSSFEDIVAKEMKMELPRKKIEKVLIHKKNAGRKGSNNSLF